MKVVLNILLAGQRGSLLQWGGCGGEEVAGQSEANVAGRWCYEGPDYSWTVGWLSVAL